MTQQRMQQHTSTRLYGFFFSGFLLVAGGQAKTLMFVQLNPDVSSYAETMSTLKFAERVSGVELGAARSSKDGNVRELMDQVSFPSLYFSIILILTFLLFMIQP